MKIPEGPTDDSADDLFQWKVKYMIEDLTQRGHRAVTVAPPLYRMAWALGWQLIPPLFANTWKSALFLGSSWAIMMGFFFWLILLFTIGELPPLWPNEFTAYFQSIGFLYGIVVALYYRFLARRLGLPSWEVYPGG